MMCPAGCGPARGLGSCGQPQPGRQQVSLCQGTELPLVAPSGSFSEVAARVHLPGGPIHSSFLDTHTHTCRCPPVWGRVS